MKLLLLFSLIPFFGFSQYPLQSTNWDFQTKQQSKMLKLGYHKVNVSMTRTWASTGKIFESERTWEAFDNKGRFIKRGIRNGGKDTITYQQFYSESGKYLGEDYNKRDVLNRKGGRIFSYDQNDSLLEIKHRYSDQVENRFSYELQGDSLVIATKFGFGINGMSTQSMEEVSRKGNTVTKILKIGEKKILTTISVYDSVGRMVLDSVYGPGTKTNQIWKYNEKGLLVKNQIVSSVDFKNVVLWEYRYDASGNRLEEKVTRGKKPEKTSTYVYKNNLLVKETNTNHYPGWDEGYTITYTYHPNGLMKTAVTINSKREKIIDKWTFSYN